MKNDFVFTKHLNDTILMQTEHTFSDLRELICEQSKGYQILTKLQLIFSHHSFQDTLNSFSDCGCKIDIACHCSSERNTILKKTANIDTDNFETE